MADYPEKVDFELVAPERLLVSRTVDMVVVPGSEGDFGVLPGHTPLISSVRAGVIDVYDENTVDERIFVSGGFAEVTGERCTVLAPEAVPVSEIDRGEVEARIKRAREDIEDAADAAERSAAEDRLRLAEAMLAHAP
ncbi:MAG: F0F1 ATP synthase subunit epsilon [Alphaproteobacteria bacterium]|nr:F0F1 ATP synthase subunit epsilon [Alphaproteobacteria bacterium]